jgi:hypothetical protein
MFGKERLDEMLCVTPALVQGTFWFKEYKSRGDSQHEVIY